MEVVKTDRELLYLLKIENDVSERMYDLLVIHLMESEEKIKKRGAELIKILDIAIAELVPRVTELNARFFYRYILVCCNKILRYDTKRTDIKDLKKRIIEEYTNAKVSEEGKIPLKYQMNEMRITFDTSYMKYLIKSLMQQNHWDKALYCWLAVSIIEPDNEALPEQYNKIKENIKKTELEKPKHEFPTDKILAMDSNVVIPMIFYDVGDFRILESEYRSIENIRKNNKLIITPSVQQEIKNHMEFQLDLIRKKCEKLEKFAFGKIKEELESRYSHIMNEYAIKEEININNEVLEKIRSFYCDYINALEKIVQEKITDRNISGKLKKLAQRESLLPESGDMNLLAEVIELNKKGEENYGILSDDKDLTVFAAPIKSAFNVDVFEK